MEKRCPRCQQTKSVDLFGVARGRRGGGIPGHCLSCRASAARQRRAQGFGSDNRTDFRHPKYRAKTAVARATKAGKLVRPTQCERCGRTGAIVAHHASYHRSAWLMVQWLCRSCHAIHHHDAE